MTTRIIRLKSSRLYLVTRFPFPKTKVWVPFVCWSGKQRDATRFKSKKQARRCLDALKSFTYGKNSRIVRLTKKG